MVTVDYLRREAVRKPTYMGLGVIKLRVKNGGAWRFYNDEVSKQTVDQCHTHTFSFKSKVIKGILRNIVYDVIPVDYETDLRLTQGACSKVCPPKTTHENVIMKETISIDQVTGTDYWMDSQTFHRIELATSSVITYKTMTDDPNIEPQFVEDKRIGYVNPWAELKTSDECWEAIDFIIRDKL